MIKAELDNTSYDYVCAHLEMLLVEEKISKPIYQLIKRDVDKLYGQYRDIYYQLVYYPDDNGDE